MITQARLKDLLTYNSDTGDFRWNKNRSGSVRAGSKAGSLKGAKHHDGYIVIKLDGVAYKAHRLAFLYMTGKFPDQCDHKNRIRDDNRWDNLRNVSIKENNQNRGIRSDNRCGHTGISFHKVSKKWAARISLDGKEKHLGLFPSIDEAILARKSVLSNSLI